MEFKLFYTCSYWKTLNMLCFLITSKCNHHWNYHPVVCMCVCMHARTCMYAHACHMTCCREEDAGYLLQHCKTQDVEIWKILKTKTL